jgi:hypothetical protein
MSLKLNYFLSFMTLMSSSEETNKKIETFESLLSQYYEIEKEMNVLIGEYNNSRNKLIYKEMWKGIEGYDNFIVSSWGRVYNVKRGVYIKQSSVGNYLHVALSNNGKITSFLVHRLIGQAFLLNPENRSSIDHIDGDCKNNNMINLRWSTHKENMQNRKIPKNSTTNFKGVSYYKPYKHYRAQIGNNGKTLHLGYFKTIEEASKVYEAKAKELFGEFYKSPINA